MHGETSLQMQLTCIDSTAARCPAQERAATPRTLGGGEAARKHHVQCIYAAWPNQSPDKIFALLLLQSEPTRPLCLRLPIPMIQDAVRKHLTLDAVQQSDPAPSNPTQLHCVPQSHHRAFPTPSNPPPISFSPHSAPPIACTGCRAPEASGRMRVRSTRRSRSLSQRSFTVQPAPRSSCTTGEGETRQATFHRAHGGTQN